MTPSTAAQHTLTHGELLQLARLNTPTVYNGWEQVTRHNPGRDGFNLEEAHDFMPQIGPMVGYAVTLVIEPGNPEHRRTNPNCFADYRRYVAGVPGPKIVVVQDLDKPEALGSIWGEVMATTHRALGCVGTITDGAIRDLDEMTGQGFKALARRLCVGHAFAAPVRWGGAVEVFGRTVQPGQLIHADKHGFLVIPDEDVPALLEAARFMDRLECDTIIRAARAAAGQPVKDILRSLDEANAAFGPAVQQHFGRQGEW